jgi:hypothetical protein
MRDACESFRIHHADCLEINAVEPGSLFDLVYLEPEASISNEDLAVRVSTLLPHLTEEGFLLVHADIEHVHAYKSVLDVFGLPFKGDVVWCYRQRAVRTKALQNHRDTLLVYSANPHYYPKRHLLAQPLVGPSSSERVGLPGQKPLELYKRLFRFFERYHRIASVLDPMMGSGSALVAALEQGRSVVGFDTSLEACRIAETRLRLAIPASQQLVMELE